MLEGISSLPEVKEFGSDTGEIQSLSCLSPYSSYSYLHILPTQRSSLSHPFFWWDWFATSVGRLNEDEAPFLVFASIFRLRTLLLRDQ